MKLQDVKESKPDIPRLWREMRLAGWNLRDLSNASRLKYHAVRDTMNGKCHAPGTIKAIAEALRVPVEEVWR